MSKFDDIIEDNITKLFRKAAKRAMKRNGYLVVARNGWVVKEFSDGTIVKLFKLNNAEAH